MVLKTAWALVAALVAFLVLLGPCLATRRLGLDVLAQLGAVLGLVFDRRDDRLVAEAPGVDQVALLGAQELQAEVADRGVGDDRDDGFQGALGRRGFRPG